MTLTTGEPQNEGSTGFGDMLTIGDFDSASDEDAEYYMQNTQKEYTTLDDALQDMDGMF
jgi:thiamine pyrophosphokinase